MAVEELAIIEEESQHFCSVGNKMTAIPDFPSGRYSNSNGILNHKELSDEKLVRSFVETHNEEAFSEIVNRYGDKIYRTALRITHNPSDAEDVLQEVFITLIEKLNSFHEESKFSTWLYRVAANESYIHLKSERKYESDISLDDYVSYDGDESLKVIKDWSNRPDEVLLSKEAMEIIEKAVNELPVPYRIVVHLRDVEGLTNPEVAEVLGLSIRCAATRVHRARLILRNQLSNYFYEWKKQLESFCMDLHPNR
jgi:RNA polymerase sigma-70 factor, ECF subfamily